MEHFLRASLWCLAGFAVVGWALCVAGALGIAFSQTGLAEWIDQTVVRTPPFEFGPLLLVFAPSTLVGILLAPRKMGNEFFRVAMRGAPRTARTALWATFACFCVVVLLLAISDRLGSFTQLMSIGAYAGVFSSSAAILLSGARRGLGEPHCPDGHPVAADMATCGLCDTPIKNVIL